MNSNGSDGTSEPLETFLTPFCLFSATITDLTNDSVSI